MGRKILLVDDDDGFRESISQTLDLFDYTVVEANNGLKALEILREQDVDLVLTDILMPEMEGVEFSEAVRNARPNLKMIAMSGGGRIGADHVAVAVKPHFEHFITKPFQRDELMNLIKDLIG